MSIKTYLELFELALNIKQLRKENRWTQRELAKKIGTSHSRISSYEDGNNESMTLNTLRKLADVFEVEIKDLMTSNQHKKGK
jgi:transcriptional regulator with XRE-family HTH domain